MSVAAIPEKIGRTGRQMCEFIAEAMRDLDGVVVDPAAIWRVSRSGELWPVFELYWTYRVRKGFEPYSVESVLEGLR